MWQPKKENGPYYLCSSQVSTVSLVRTACRSIQQKVNTIKTKAHAMLTGGLINESILGQQVIEGCTSFEQALTRYFFNGEYYDSWYFVVAEVLDARVYKGLGATSIDSGFDFIRNKCVRGREFVCFIGQFLSKVWCCAGRKDSMSC